MDTPSAMLRAIVRYWNWLTKPTAVVWAVDATDEQAISKYLAKRPEHDDGRRITVVRWENL